MIRECIEKDKKIWIELNKEFMLFEYEDDNVWENPLSKGDPGEIFLQIISNKNSTNRLFIVENEVEPIGFMNTVTFFSICAHGKVLFLDDFFIRETHRGKGNGKKALKELENLLLLEDYKRVQLMAENTNPKAVAFYTKEGYSKQHINFFCKYL